MLAFCYEMSFPLDIDELQYDGQPFMEHCSVDKQMYNSRTDFTKLIIDKNIGDLKCNICLGDLVRDDKRDWYGSQLFPIDLLAQAVINCVERQNKLEEKPKVRKLTKDKK